MCLRSQAIRFLFNHRTVLDDATLEAQLREAYPELAYLAIGPRLHDDASLSDGLPKHERCVLAAMVLAVRLAAPDGARPPGGSRTVSGIDAAVHSIAEAPAAADDEDAFFQAYIKVTTRY